MSVLSARSNTSTRNAVQGSAVSAVSDNFYQGALAYHNRDDGITPVAASGYSLAGVVAETKLAAVSGDEIALMIAGQFSVPTATFTPQEAGRMVWCDISAASDNPTDLIIGSPEANDFTVGRYIGEIDGKSWVDINQGNDPDRS